MSIMEITREYEKTVSRQKSPVIVEFYARWCPKCAMMKEVIENLSGKYKGKWNFYKVDIDLSKEVADYLGIEIVPTFVVYKRGTICGYTTGVLTENVLEERIRQMLI